MDILELIRDDHLDSLTTVRELLTIADRADAGKKVALLLERLREGVALHVQSERVAFDQAAQAARDRSPELDEMIQRSAREHLLIERLVRLCSSVRPCADHRLQRALTTLEDVLGGHVFRAQYQLGQVLDERLDREERDGLGRVMMAEQVRLLGLDGGAETEEATPIQLEQSVAA